MNKQDRCDKCGAQAMHRFSRPADSAALDLMFCNHHTETFLAGLTGQGFVTVESVDIIEAASSLINAGD